MRFKSDYDAAVHYHEQKDNEIESLVSEFKRRRGKGRVSWSLINAARLTKIWTDFGKMGIIRDEKGMDDICEIMVRNTIRIRVITEMMGHTQLDMREYLLEMGHKFSDKMWDDKMTTFFTDKNGNWLISDYGLDKLEHHCVDLLKADTYEDMAYAVDKMLNVVHQRSDLASWFVEGGSKTLSKIQEWGTKKLDNEQILT